MKIDFFLSLFVVRERGGKLNKNMSKVSCHVES